MRTPIKFIHKPTVVEAWQWQNQAEDEWPPWLKTYQCNGRGVIIDHSGPRLLIFTMDDLFFVKINDWIVRGPQGSLYPLAPLIFTTYYEPMKS